MRGSHTRSGIGGVLLCLVLCACGDPLPPPELTLELGTGESMFEPLTDEQEVPLVAGPQGGHHVWLSLRVGGLSQGENDHVLLDLDMVLLNDTEPPPRRAPVRLLMSPDEDGHLYIGWPAQLEAPECAVGERMSIRATITSTDGRMTMDERIVVPLDDPLLDVCDA